MTELRFMVVGITVKYCVMYNNEFNNTLPSELEHFSSAYLLWVFSHYQMLNIRY